MEEPELSEDYKKFLKSLKSGTWGSYPLEKMTKNDFLAACGTDPMQRVIDLATTGTNQGLVITSVNIVEYLLSFLLAKKGKGTSRNLAGKILAAKENGILSHEQCSLFDTLRLVRNRFAHDHALFHFEHDSEVVRLLDSIAMDQSQVKVVLRMKFFAAITHLVSALKKQL